MTTQIAAVSNRNMTVGLFTSAAVAVPQSAVAGVQVDINRSGLPAGRAGDGLLCDIGMLVTYDGANWQQYSAEIQGGAILDDNGVTLTIQDIKFQWGDLGRPAQAKLFCNTYVAFRLTATLSAF